MALKVQIRVIDGTTVITCEGVGCTELLHLVLDGLDEALSAERRVVIDLDGATLTDSHRVGDLVDALASIAPQVSLVCGRLTARRLLRSAPAADRVAVFPTVADALRRPWTEPSEVPPPSPTAERPPPGRPRARRVRPSSVVVGPTPRSAVG